MSARPWEQAQETARTRKRPTALDRLWRFFQKNPEPLTFTANRKGQGFYLFTPPKSNGGSFPFAAFLLGVAATAVTGFIFYKLRETPQFALLITSVLALTALLIWDILSRRAWERNIASKIHEMCGKHDRLVRETARNRSDIAILKEGLGTMAQSVAAQSSRTPAGTGESKIIQTIVTQLGALGSKPRAQLGTSHDSEILELEMAPPPARSAPLSELDNEFLPNFDNYTDAVITEKIRHAVRNDEIEVFMQPIVALPQRKARMHEIYARVRAGGGAYIPAERYLDAAHREDLLPAIDNLLLLRCLNMLKTKRGDAAAPYIINISGTTLNDRGFMNDLVSFLSQNHKMASQLIFELPQRELEEQGAALGPVIDGLSKLGVRFSMDRVRNRVIDIGMLRARNIRFIKMDAAWLLKEGYNRPGWARIVRLKKQLDAAGIDLIVERIEREAMLRELLDFNIDYGQGFLFGKPDHYAAYRDLKAAA